MGSDLGDVTPQSMLVGDGVEEKVWASAVGDVFVAVKSLVVDDLVEEVVWDAAAPFVFVGEDSLFDAQGSALLDVLEAGPGKSDV